MTTIKAIVLLTEARERMQLAWRLYAAKRESERMLARYVRSLRRCERLTNLLKKP